MNSSSTLPRRVLVSDLLTGRYPPGSRPVSWDDRLEGIETVVTSDGQTIRLFSNGGQSTPAKNWEILLTSQNHDSVDSSFTWTLYGIKGGLKS